MKKTEKGEEMEEGEDEDVWRACLCMNERESGRQLLINLMSI